MSRRAARPQRTPLGRRNILTTDQRKGFVRRWVNDVDDRLARAEAAGYQRVSGDAGVGDGQQAGADSQIGATVSKSVGGGIKAVLMEIPEEFFREDQEAKMREVDAREESLRPNKGEGQYGSLEIEARRGPGRPRKALTAGSAED